MTENRLTEDIRVKVLCVFRQGSRVLVCEYYDPTTREPFYCPPGGGIEYGEPSLVALRREMREELGTEIEDVRLLGVLENLFIHGGRQGHEIVFVYDADLVNDELYQVTRLEAQESTGEVFDVIWLDLNAMGPDTPPLFPEGLVQMLEDS